MRPVKETWSASVARRLCRNRRRRIGRDRDRGTRLELELTDRYDAITGLDAFEDLGTAVHAVPGLHEGANRRQAGLAVVGLLVGDDEHRVAIERVVHRGFGNGDDGRL